MSVIQVDLSGEWIGHYTGHFDEVVKITQRGTRVEAIKITGDDYVPAGEITWRADLGTGLGEGQVAEEGFRNARFIPGQLKVLGREKIVFHWLNSGRVEYRRDE